MACKHVFSKGPECPVTSLLHLDLTINEPASMLVSFCSLFLQEALTLNV